ncbi:conserved hypothetical protein [Thermosulfidibacter takaii ABI70S6]|uniref:YbbR-like domain-containing protein n=1 Tax=Thermosulfidibacter takaii (strain DSM 17441 / JCM 13301 / NBRC 103674 / ABI70S6) TaxID=1298851 RepID=A0A0S3QUH3_THET7|nr:CdaR family protein [Thermosulfidibacter takaii]BAT71984.1 conserved hypothetical protein [Thermosulfidibacter takaii ABI70S6]
MFIAIDSLCGGVKIRGIAEKILALLVGFLLWNYVVSQGYVEVVFEAPIEVKNLPEDVMVEGLPRSVKVRVEGAPWLVKQVGPGEIKVELRLKEITEGYVTVSFDNVKVPEGLRVLSVEPDHARIKIVRLIKKNVPVRVSWKKRPKFNWKTNPILVEVKGPKKSVVHIKYIKTEEINPEELEKEKVKEVYLKIPSGVQVNPAKVVVEVVR